MKKNYLKICLLIFVASLLILESNGLKAHNDSTEKYLQSQSLSHVLDEISDSYEVYFSYDSKTIEAVYVDFTFGENEEIDELMGRLLGPTELNHKTYGDKYYVIVENTREGKRQARKLKKRLKELKAIEKKNHVNSIDINDKRIIPSVGRIDEASDDVVFGPIISGTVTSASDDQPLVGVNILIKGTASGTITDLDGRYEIELPEDEATLVFSYTGFISMEVATASRTTIDIALIENAEALEEVVVIGYGTAKKSDITGAVASIKGDELVKVASVRVDDALRGKVSGLQITPTSGAPGAASTIRIRGSNSISANNEPLYVIDGFIGGGDLNSINVNDIQSIEVLKDASATALYGSRGSNGVILITTKRGENGQAKLNFDSFIGFQNTTKLFEMLNASEYASWINEIQGSEVYPNPSSFGEGTDWQREIFQENAPMTSHTLSVSGGNEKTKYFLSGNYFDQDALYLGGNLKRYQLRFNADHQVNKMVRIGNSLTMSRTIDNPRGSNIINTAGWTPLLPVRDDNGEFTFQTFSSEFSGDNPVATTRSITNTQTRNTLLGNVYGEIEPIEGLIYKISLGSSLETGRNQNYQPSTLFQQQGLNGTASVRNIEDLDLLIENTLSYSKVFGDHSLNALVGYTRQRIFNTESFVSVRDFVTDAFTFNNLGAGVDRNISTSEASEIGFESYLFRAQYSWRNKFLFTASARSDASSVFGANNKRALFPSGAFAWRLIQEDFIKDLGVFDDLKVRASYGRLGNPGLGFGASLTRLDNAGNNYILGVNQDVVAGIAANSLGNDNLQWETTDQFDIGIDAGFFNNRLQVTFDYYEKRTNNLLIRVDVPWLTSFANSLTNFGSVSNKGVELSITTVNVNSNDFKWETNFNISRNRNMVVDIFNEEGFLFTNPIGGVEAVVSGILQEGQPIGTFYGMVRDGIWNSQAEIEASGLSGFSVFPGGKRFEDLDGDGVIAPTMDRQIIGNADPDFFGGIGNNLSYKGFDLSFFWAFNVGNEIFNETDSRVGTALDNNTFKRFADRWTPTNTESNIPSAEGAARTLVTSDTDVIEDGSFLRLRNISLGYSLPLANVSWISSARVYVSGINLLTFDSYSGYDPEVNRGFGNLRRGYDQAQYPTAKIVNFGVQLGF